VDNVNIRDPKTGKINTQRAMFHDNTGVRQKETAWIKYGDKKINTVSGEICRQS